MVKLIKNKQQIRGKTTQSTTGASCILLKQKQFRVKQVVYGLGADLDASKIANFPNHNVRDHYAA